MDGASTTTPGVRIVLSSDKQTASLVIDMGVDAGGLSAEAIDAAAGEQGVMPTPDRVTNIRSAIAGYAQSTGERPFEAPIVRGRLPEHGVDGAIIFEPRFDPTAEHEEADPSTAGEAVDYYSQSAFTLVRAGQTIARITDATKGVDGCDVTGEPLEARSGTPCELELDGVELNERRQLVATRDGIVEYEPGRLCVLSELRIEDNVDFSTGNISFQGNVFVTKGVKDCFTVRVGGSLTVGELVEAAALVCAVDCTLHRGVAARGKGSIKTGRDLSANYLNSALVYVGRDLHVHREIGSCTVHVSRCVVSPQAALVGGVLMVGSRCHLGQVGSASGTSTTIVLGAMAELDDLDERLAELLPAWEARATRARTRLQNLGGAGATDANAEAAALQALATQAEAAVEQILAATEQVHQVQRDYTFAQLRVDRMLHAGVRIRMGGYDVVMMQDVKGPVCLAMGCDGQPHIAEPKSAPPLAKVASIRRAEGPLEELDPGDEPEKAQAA